MTRAHLGLALSVVAALLAWAPIAWAPIARAQDDEAHRTFLRAAAAYGNGDYETAARLFEEAYELRPEPSLLHSLGLARERAGMVGPAIEAYEAFLEAAPDAEERPDVERSLETLRRQRALEEEVARREAEAAAEAERAIALPVEPEPRREREPSVAPWVVLGVGAATLVVAAVLGGVALSRYDEARAESAHARTLALAQEANDLGLGANVLFGVGGAVALAGLLWGTLELVLDPSEDGSPSGGPDVALRIGGVEIR